MARVLVCLEDTGVAYVITARLMRDGVEGVVVDKPTKLVDEARKGAATLVVQDRYPSGEIGSSLLRQVRVALGEVVPAVVVVTGDLAAPDRHVLEKQYKVQAFLPVNASPLQIADAARGAGGLTTGFDIGPSSEDELVLHDDEAKNEFDISVDSQVRSRTDGFSFDDDDDDDDNLSSKTVEITQGELLRLKRNGIVAEPTVAPVPGSVIPVAVAPLGAEANMIPRRVQEEITNVAAQAAEVSDSNSDLSQLPAPGGDNDFDLQPKATMQNPLPVSALVPVGLARSGTPAPAVLKPSSALALPNDPPSVAAASDDEEDPMQIQELQRTQAELKRALLAERKARETAQKRVEELEARLTKMGEAPASTGQGVPTEGVFEDLRYPVLLARARSEAFTGSIMMATGGSTRTVYLKDGLPVAFSSSEPGQRIGKVLVSQGRITDEQYMKAATRMVEKSIKLTDALVELGLIDGESLAIEQRNLTRDQIIQGFEIIQGRFTTAAGSTPDVNTVTFDFGPGEIYVQGYRRYAPANEMLAGFETLRDKYLIANARLAGYRPKLGLSGEDERLLRLLGEALTVEEAVERANLTPEHCARLLSALQALDLVEEWSPGVEQFRSRIRSERQRQAEEIATQHQEHRRREDRLLEAFERVLGGRADASSLSAALGAPLPAVAVVAERPAEKREEKRDDKRNDDKRNDDKRNDDKRAPFPKADTAKGGMSSLASTLSAMAAASASASPPPSASDFPTPTASPTSSSSMMTAPPAPSEPSSPADRKYREGIEQATQNRLDEAELTLREAVRLDATRPEYLTSLARVLLGNPRYERAGTLPVVRSLLDRAVQIAPDHTEAVDLHKQVIAEMGG